MKYNDNGTYKDIYVKSFDTLPVGAIVEYSGSTIPNGWTDIGNNQIQKTSQYIEGGAGLPSYFTDEIDTGMKWIDGKPIYRKVIQYTPSSTIGESGKRTVVNIPHNISNFNHLIDCEGFIDTENNNFIILPSVNNSATSFTTFTIGTIIQSITATNIVINIFNDTWGTNRIFNIILEYTKTTD